MSEEKPSEPLEFVIISFGLIVIFIFFAKNIIDTINVFVYFFSKSNSQYVCEMISELITVSAGTPGDVNINFMKPKDYNYNVYFNGKMVFVELTNFKKPSGLSDEDLEKFANRSYSSTAVAFNANNFLNFDIITIQKKDDINLFSIGGFVAP